MISDNWTERCVSYLNNNLRHYCRLWDKFLWTNLPRVLMRVELPVSFKLPRRGDSTRGLKKKRVNGQNNATRQGDLSELVVECPGEWAKRVLRTSIAHSSFSLFLPRANTPRCGRNVAGRLCFSEPPCFLLPVQMHIYIHLKVFEPWALSRELDLSPWANIPQGSRGKPSTNKSARWEKPSGITENLQRSMRPQTLTKNGLKKNNRNSNQFRMFGKNIDRRQKCQFIRSSWFAIDQKLELTSFD